MRAIIQHLRFPFSFLLLPVFLFSVFVFHSGSTDNISLILLGIILHLLVYPSSNAFNSTQDRDKGSIGLIENPLPPPSNLLLITLVMDVLAVMVSCFINWQVAVLVLIYIIASRLYSWRKVRLKKYPVTGFLTVFVCQGALVFFIVVSVFFPGENLPGSFYLISIIPSLFIGSMYPLSQIYQHEQDRLDDVRTISAALGYRNTFIFSGFQFLLASAAISWVFISMGELNLFFIYMFFQIPVISFFLFWFYKVMKDTQEANFKNTMLMNIISAVCMNLCFIFLLLFK